MDKEVILRKHESVAFGEENTIFYLRVDDGYKFFFETREDKGFERTKDQVLAIMECQYGILGELIMEVKKY